MNKIFSVFLILISLNILTQESYTTIKSSIASLKMSGVNMDVELSQISEEEWKITSVIKVPALFSRTEESNFMIKENSVIPISWSRSEKVIFRGKKDYLVTFDWSLDELSYKEHKKSGKLKITKGTLGPATGPLMLRLELRKNGIDNLPKEISANVYFKGQIKKRKYVIGNLEKIETPIGSFEALRVDRVRSEENPRKEVFWFSPELDFSLIKVTNDDGKNVRELLISSYEEI